MYQCLNDVESSEKLVNVTGSGLFAVHQFVDTVYTTNGRRGREREGEREGERGKEIGREGGGREREGEIGREGGGREGELEREGGGREGVRERGKEPSKGETMILRHCTCSKAQNYSVNMMYIVHCTCTCMWYLHILFQRNLSLSIGME